MKRPGHKNFNAVSHNHSRPEVLCLNLTWRSRGQISSVLLQLLLFAFSNRKFGRHGKSSVTFWQWENINKARTWLWDTALKFFGRAFSLRHQITWNLTLAHRIVPSSSVVKHPTRSRRVVGSNPSWDSDFSDSTFLLEFA